MGEPWTDYPFKVGRLLETPGPGWPVAREWCQGRSLDAIRLQAVYETDRVTGTLSLPAIRMETALEHAADSVPGIVCRRYWAPVRPTCSTGSLRLAGASRNGGTHNDRI